MTNKPERYLYGDLITDGDAAGARLAADLEALYAAPVADLRFTPPLERRDGLAAGRRWRWWQPVAAAGVAAAAVAAVLIAPSLWRGESQVSAAEIFARASTAAETNAPALGATTYHLISTTGAPDQPGTPTTSETWYADTSHFRIEQEYDATNSGPDFGLLVSGDDAWLYGTFDGVHRAAHGPASELGTTFGEVAPGTSTTIDQVLAQYSRDCQRASNDGESEVAGRRAYEIVVTPDFEACPANADGESAAGKLGMLRLWVDQETFLPLKTEQLDTAGDVMYVYEVTQIDIGGSIPEPAFTYQAPAGGTVQDVANLSEAKFVLSGQTPDGAPAE